MRKKIMIKDNEVDINKDIPICYAENIDIPDKDTSAYRFSKKLPCCAYYINSVSYNNYVSLQNNYKL